MKVLLVGGGGREHSMAWQMAQSRKCTELYCAPGNAGIEECATRVNISAEDVEALVAFAKEKEIDFVVVGPEAPLVNGIVDALEKEGIKAFGPSADAAELEGSKVFMKELCSKYNIPTAAFGRFEDLDKAKVYISKQKMPIVIKADGLAAGKGVFICNTVEEAQKIAEEILEDGSFGNAGNSIVIEEFLDGEELSFFAISDGKTVLPLTSAQDHKRVGDGDTGLNTGGMGAYSPAHMMDEELGKKITQKIIEPTVAAMKEEGKIFKGILFAGIMLVDNEPILLEFNVRFGDPECQVLMMRMYCDLLELLYACSEEKLLDIADDIYWRNETALCVVIASKGYPGAYKKGTVIKSLNDADIMPYTKIFHAGTEKNEEGDFINVGGRVLGITSLGTTVEEANANAYKSVQKVKWPEGFCRKDIGYRAISSQNKRTAA
jgi:phosphoribosylamine--glycine ligase